MIIILEGENKTGKTTLAKHLMKKYDFEYVKCSQPKGDPYVEYMEILKKIEKSKKDTVIDRFLYGEFVYGPLYRGKSGLTDTQKRNIELKALSLNPLLIYCYDTEKNIKERYLKEKEDFADSKLIRKTLQLFEDIIGKSNLVVMKHRMMTKEDLTKSEKLNDFISTRKYYDQFKHLKTAIGNTQDPKLVLVGERRNENQRREYKKYHQPFDFGPSSEYLFDELKRGGIELKDVMIINSDTTDLYDINDYFHVEALGKAASKKLTRIGRGHQQISHPSYERRFHSKKHRLAKHFKELRTFL